MISSPEQSVVETTERSDIPAWARERAEMLQGLYIHGMIFVLINAGLFGINYFMRGEDGNWWFQWPLLIWGLGFLVHVMVTVVPVFSTDWVDRRARKMASKGR